MGATEIKHLLHFVYTLTECTTAYECDFVTERTCTRADVEDAPDAVVALYYRSLYGGMKGDMRMLINAVHHFTDHAIMIGPPMIRPHTASSTLSILMEAIDYHPRPPLLDILHQKTLLDKERIKSLIWRAESCINVRKPHTLKDSEEVQQSMEWLTLSPILDEVRMRFQ